MRSFRIFLIRDEIMIFCLWREEKLREGDCYHKDYKRRTRIGGIYFEEDLENILSVLEF